MLDEHYGGPRPAPRRAVRPKTPAEKAFAALGPAAEAVPRRVGGLGEHQAGLGPGRAGCAARRARRPGAHRGAGAGGGVPPLAGRGRPVHPGRRGPDPQPRPAGDALVIELPKVPVRPLSAYKIEGAS